MSDNVIILIVVLTFIGFMYLSIYGRFTLFTEFTLYLKSKILDFIIHIKR